MFELVRGYAAGALDAADRERTTAEVAGGLTAVAHLLVSSQPLRDALTDPGIPAAERAAVLEDLLSGKVPRDALAMVTFAAQMERAADLPKTIEQLVQIAEHRARRAADGAPVESETPIGRSGTFERIRGYGEYTFEQVPRPEEVDEIEDELFRFARIVEQHHELRSALGDHEGSLAKRLAILHSLLWGKGRPATLELVSYVLRAGRVRDLTLALDYLVELAAAERGRRVAEVHAAVELSQAERDRLASALSRIARRPVEIRLTIDSSVLGGISVQLGDTVIDGTVRHRLEQLKETLLQSA